MAKRKRRMSEVIARIVKEDHELLVRLRGVSWALRARSESVSADRVYQKRLRLECKALRAEGFSAVQIAEIFGLSKQQIHRVLLKK